MTDAETITANIIVMSNVKSEAVRQLVEAEIFSSKNKASKYYHKTKVIDAGN